MQPEKKKLTDPEKEAILVKALAGKGAAEIGRELGIHGQVVNGYLSWARNGVLQGTLQTRQSLPNQVGSGPVGPIWPRPTPLLVNQEDQLKILAKNWRTSEPDAEFSIHSINGQRIYIAVYKDGLVLKIGEQKKTVALLTPAMAARFGVKLNEMATWSRFR